MSGETEELYSLLIPLAEDRLIVPRACVAEVVRFTAPEQEAGAHSWMMGSVNWNGRSLPVASFEGTLGKDDYHFDDRFCLLHLFTWRAND